MKKNIRILGLLIISILLVFSCKKDEIEFKKADPTGGFADADLTVIGGYMDETTYTLTSGLNLFNVEAGSSYTVTLAIDESTVDAKIQDAIALIQTSVTVSNPETTFDILTVDFSEIEADTVDVEDVFTINMTAEGLNLEKASTTIDVLVRKTKIPVLAYPEDLSLSNAYINVHDTAVNFIYTIELLDVPSEQEIVIPITFDEIDVTEGVQYNCADHNFRIGVGETSASVTIEVLEAGFTPGYLGNELGIELYKDSIPSGIILTVKEDSYSTTLLSGVLFDWDFPAWYGTYTCAWTGSTANASANPADEESLNLLINDNDTLIYNLTISKLNSEWGDWGYLYENFVIDPYLVINDTAKAVIDINWGRLYVATDRIRVLVYYNVYNRVAVDSAWVKNTGLSKTKDYSFYKD